MTVTAGSFLRVNAFKVNEDILEIDNPAVFKWINIYNSVLKQIPDYKNKYLIKLNLIKSSRDKLYFHVVYLNNFCGFINDPFLPVEIPYSNQNAFKSNEIKCLIIPTGVGALFGGYAGDASPIAKLFGADAKYLLTHPNVVNGAVLSDLPQNLIYLEGFLLDQFLTGKINLKINTQNKIGVIFDKGISEERLEYEVNVLNALKAVYGCKIIGWTQTEKPVTVKPEINKYGFSSGKIENLQFVVEKALKLKEQGATAIAVCLNLPDLELNPHYILGSGIDPIGGVESIISHVVSSAIGLVCAHAPVLVLDEKTNYKKISPVSAGEYIARTFLPSVISGLRFAPLIVSNSSGLSYREVSSLIVPYNAFGSAGVFHLAHELQNVFLVKENKTSLSVNPLDINLKFNIVEKYSELIDLKKADDMGIDAEVFERPLGRIPNL